jgi:hypothetical protein
LKTAIALLPILSFTSPSLEISDTLTAEVRVSPSLCGKKVEIFTRAGDSYQALETLKEIVKSLKELGFKIRVEGYTPRGKGERATAKVTLILENPRELDRLVWTLENIKLNYPSVRYSLSSQGCAISPQKWEDLRETLRELLLKKAQERTRFFSEKLGMDCRLKEFHIEGIKQDKSALLGKARVIWVCYP